MKIAVVIRSKSDLPVQMNALAHLCVGLQDLVGIGSLKLRRFLDPIGSHVSTMTDYPLIVFAARNGAHLKAAHQRAVDARVPCNVFFECMRSADPLEQYQHVNTHTASEHDYLGLAMFGSHDELKPLTRQFSLMRSD